MPVSAKNQGEPRSRCLLKTKRRIIVMLHGQLSIEKANLTHQDGPGMLSNLQSFKTLVLLAIGTECTILSLGSGIIEPK